MKCCWQVLTTYNIYSIHVAAHVEKKDDCYDDLVLCHTRALLTVGLYRLYHNKMIKYGDAEKTVQSCKHFMLRYKNLGLWHYSKRLLETQYQAAALPAPQKTSLIWNCYVNNWGRADSCVPKNLDLEHKNYTLKQELKSYQGDYTQKSLDKISKASNIRCEIWDNFARATGHYVLANLSRWCRQLI